MPRLFRALNRIAILILLIRSPIVLAFLLFLNPFLLFTHGAPP